MHIIDLIRTTLNTQWDPIGIYGTPPEAEYDTYALALNAMMEKGADEAALARYLLEVETDKMRLVGDPDRAALTAGLIVTLYQAQLSPPELKPHPELDAKEFRTLVAHFGNPPNFGDSEVHRFALTQSGQTAIARIAISDLKPGAVRPDQYELVLTDVRELTVSDWRFQNVLHNIIFAFSETDITLRFIAIPGVGFEGVITAGAIEFRTA